MGVRAEARSPASRESSRMAERCSPPAPREPRRLRRGKTFHRSVQLSWSNVKGAIFEKAIRDLHGRRRRIDVFIDDGEEWVSIVEIKRSDWDRMRPDRVRPNALRHARQTWLYIEPFLEHSGGYVCPGILYEKLPTTPGRVAEVESILHERGLQVVWQNESKADLRARMRKSDQ